MNLFKEDPDELEQRIIQELTMVVGSGDEAYNAYNDFINQYNTKHKTIHLELLRGKQYNNYKNNRAETFRRYANINYYTSIDKKKALDNFVQRIIKEINR